MLDLKNKTAIVIGGLGGLGIEIIRQLVDRKIQKLGVIDVVKYPFSNPAFAPLVQTTVFAYRQAEVQNAESLRQALTELAEELGAPFILVNSAGVLRENDPATTISVNYLGVVNSTLAGVELMRKDKGGQGGLILNLASLAALTYSFLLPVYCGTKHAVLGFTKAIANKAFHERTGISFITICPGVTETPILSSMMDRHLFPEMKEELEKEITVFPVQQPPVVGECVIQAIDDGENGATWQVDNGIIKKIDIVVYPSF